MKKETLGDDKVKKSDFKKKCITFLFILEILKQQQIEDL